MVKTERQEHVQTSKVGHGQDFIYCTQRTAVSANNIVLRNIIHYCTVNLHYPTLCLWSKDGKSVLGMDQLQSIIQYFFKQLSTSYIREILFPNTEHSKVFKAIFVSCLYATHSCIFVNNSKLVHPRLPYPILSHKRHAVQKKNLTYICAFISPPKICLKYSSC